MDGVVVPHKEGLVSKGVAVLDENGFIQKYEFNVGQARNLIGFESEFVFFTPAILYLHGGFRDAPFADLMYMSGTEIKLHYRNFAKPIFTGLEAHNGNPDWNYVLWAVQKEHWKTLSDWLVSITLSYSRLGEVAGIGEQSLDITDPLAEERILVYHGQLRRTSVYAFGLNGSKFKAYFKQSTEPHIRPKLVFADPAEDMRYFAAALHQGLNPVDVRTAHKHGVKNEG